MDKEYAFQLLTKHAEEAVDALDVPRHRPTPNDIKRISQFAGELGDQTFMYAVLPFDQPKDAGFVKAIQMNDSMFNTVILEYGDTTKLHKVMRDSITSIETMGPLETQSVAKLMWKNDFDLAIIKDKKRIFFNTLRMQLFFQHFEDFPEDRPDEMNWHWLVQSMVMMNFKVAEIERIENKLWSNAYPKDSAMREIMNARRPLKIVELIKTPMGQMVLGLLGIFWLDLIVGLEWMTSESRGFDLVIILVLIFAGFSYHHASKKIPKVSAFLIALAGILSYLGVLWWKGILQM